MAQFAIRINSDNSFKPHIPLRSQLRGQCVPQCLCIVPQALPQRCSWRFELGIPCNSCGAGRAHTAARRHTVNTERAGVCRGRMCRPWRIPRSLDTAPRVDRSPPMPDNVCNASAVYCEDRYSSRRSLGTHARVFRERTKICRCSIDTDGVRADAHRHARRSTAGTSADCGRDGTSSLHRSARTDATASSVRIGRHHRSRHSGAELDHDCKIAAKRAIPVDKDGNGFVDGDARRFLCLRTQCIGSGSCCVHKSHYRGSLDSDTAACHDHKRDAVALAGDALLQRPQTPVHGVAIERAYFPAKRSRAWQKKRASAAGCTQTRTEKHSAHSVGAGAVARVAEGQTLVRTDGHLLTS